MLLWCLDIPISPDFLQVLPMLCDYMHDIWPLMLLYFNELNIMQFELLFPGLLQHLFEFHPWQPLKVALFCMNRKLTISSSIRICCWEIQWCPTDFTSAIVTKPGQHPVHLKTTFPNFHFFRFTDYRRISFYHQSKRLHCFISLDIYANTKFSNLIMKNNFEGRYTSQVLIFMIGFYMIRHQFTHFKFPFLIFPLLFRYQCISVWWNRVSLSKERKCN